MQHLGDITTINWFEVEPVDCVTGGSPCQDLSVAGKRAGLAGERSGLYMEQIRCTKELRQNDVNNGRTGAMVRPRWMVWENVPGAFSSNGGKDFAAVLEEAVKIVEPQAPSIPVPDKGWPSAGCLSDVDGKWSIAWRVHDAQFWGVPQRRKRIALLCDYGGLEAPRIMFDPQLEREAEIAGACFDERNFGRESRCTIHNEQRSCEGDYAQSSNEGQDNKKADAGCVQQPIAFNIGSYHSNAWNSNNPDSGMYETETFKTLDAITCGNPTCNQGGTVIVRPVLGNGKEHMGPILANCGTKQFLGNQEAFSGDYTVIRGGLPYRPTLLECERAQGYPDGWTDIGEWTDSKGKKHKAADSPRYKALGNSIALPFWFWLLRRISAQYERPATLGSLFDGIGGFPLCWERCNGKGTALWASEIEEFAMAVTKVRFS